MITRAYTTHQLGGINRSSTIVISAKSSAHLCPPRVSREQILYSFHAVCSSNGDNAPPRAPMDPGSPPQAPHKIALRKSPKKIGRPFSHYPPRIYKAAFKAKSQKFYLQRSKWTSWRSPWPPSLLPMDSPSSFDLKRILTQH